MSREYNPVNVRCNLKCTYCFENPIREAGNTEVAEDWSKVELRLKEAPFTLFGGEALLAGYEKIEKLYELGANGIQTNGVLINDKYIELFKKHKSSVGISIDGPPSLNTERCPGPTTQRVMDNIVKLVNAGISPGLIITVYKTNASRDVLPRFINWIHWLDDIGVTHARLHTLESYYKPELRLSEEDKIYAFTEIYKVSKELKRLKFDIFDDMKKGLAHDDKRVCVFKECDPFNTVSVYGINPDGSVVNCHRLYKDGVITPKADGYPTKRRSRALWAGDCKGCEYFLSCLGGCTGESAGGDWTRKTEQCSLYKHLFKTFVDEGCKFIPSTEESVKEYLSYDYKQHKRIVHLPIGRKGLEAKQNGFRSFEEQEEHHNWLLEQIRSTNYDTIIDLGCGNGALLRKLTDKRTIGYDIRNDVRYVDNLFKEDIYSSQDRDFTALYLVSTERPIPEWTRDMHCLYYSYNQRKASNEPF